MDRSKVYIIFYFVFFSCLYGSLSAQEFNSATYRVVDNGNNRPIIFATIILQDAGVGVVSDEYGNFRIPIRFLGQGERIRISCIGYVTRIFDLERPSNNDVKVLGLDQKLEALDEVVLSTDNKEEKYSGRKIVKLAIKNIPNNYPRSPYGYISYYRDYQKLINTQNLPKDHPLNAADYVNLNEGILKMYDAGFGTNKFFDDSNQSALLQFGPNRTFLRDSSLAVPYDNYNIKYLSGVTFSPLGGNELYLLHIGDCIRNYDQQSFSFVDIMKKDFVKRHIFKIDKLMYLDDEPIYKIDFFSSIQSMDPYFRGQGSIYIGKLDYGIHRLNYVTSDVRRSKDLYEVNIEYKKNKDQYYLNYLTFNNFFDSKHGDVFQVENLVYNYESSSFQVFFNREIDVRTIDKTGRTLAFYYKKKKLDIKEISLIDPKTLNVSLYSFYADMDRNLVENDVRYSIRKVQDINGNVINDGPLIGLKQFREIFVQEVFEKLDLDSTYNYVEKVLPLSESKTNSYPELQKYWVNTPLKESK